MSASITFNGGLAWVLAAALIVYVAWVVVVLVGAKTLSPEDPAGFSDSELARLPVRLHVVEALDDAGAEADKVWPTPIASRRTNQHLLDAEFSPYDRPPEAA